MFGYVICIKIEFHAFKTCDDRFFPPSLSPLSRKIGQKYFNSSTIYFDRICNTTLNCVVLMRFTYCASHLAWQWSAVCAHTQDSFVNLNLISSDGCLCLVPMFVFFFFFLSYLCSPLISYCYLSILFLSCVYIYSTSRPNQRVTDSPPILPPTFHRSLHVRE